MYMTIYTNTYMYLQYRHCYEWMPTLLHITIHIHTQCSYTCTSSLLQCLIHMYMYIIYKIVKYGSLQETQFLNSSIGKCLHSSFMYAAKFNDMKWDTNTVHIHNKRANHVWLTIVYSKGELQHLHVHVGDRAKW